ncbi:MAG: efflux RND transporter periplasmic adaptor subunit [Desulfuromonas sp.]|nr:MAG: efflux RND transporter periplasmic adaptor subunit [Desulfuromonas sp.]
MIGHLRKKRIWLAAIVLVAGAALLFAAFGSSAPTPPQFKTATLTRGTLEKTIASTGTLAAVETVEVGTQISGTIEDLKVDYNSTVKKGDLLARIDAALYEAALSEAQAGVEKAKATLAEAEETLQRDQPLYVKGYLSAQEFAPSRTAVATAKAGLSSAEAALLRAQTNLDYTVIRSPIDGTVIERSVEAGQTVAASLNTPTLFILARDLKQMQIEVNVDESDIGLIRKGQPVRFTVQAWPEEKFNGEVTQIRLQPTTISNVVNYTVLVKAENDDGKLLPGMTATVDFVVARLDEALLVPNAALRFSLDDGSGGSNDRRHLYTFDTFGAPAAVEVEPGESDGLVTAVNGEKLHEGMQVIVGLENASASSSGSKNLFSFMRPPRPPSGGGK